MTVADKSTGKSIEDFLNVQICSSLEPKGQRAQKFLALAKQIRSPVNNNEKAPPKRGLFIATYFFLGAGFLAAGFLAAGLAAAFLAAGFAVDFLGAASTAGAWSW